jgi:succinate dehydrogenase / fumarate reductase cytochrome b subunit
MQHFWYVMHFGGIEQVLIDGELVKDLHTEVMAFFNPERNSLALLYVGLYVFAMAAMGYHLQHGFSSAFQSMGLNHEKYTPLINKIGTAFCILVPLAFASIPVFLYYNQIAH